MTADISLTMYTTAHCVIFCTVLHWRYIKPLCNAAYCKRVPCVPGWEKRDSNKSSISDEVGQTIQVIYMVFCIIFRWITRSCKNAIMQSQKSMQNQTKYNLHLFLLKSIDFFTCAIYCCHLQLLWHEMTYLQDSSWQIIPQAMWSQQPT